MPFRGCCRLLVVPLIGLTLAFADTTPPPHMTKRTREEVIRAFNAELCYIRTNFPMGKTGLKLKDGVLTPNGEQLQQLMALWGPAAKPGDQARITDVVIKDDHIRFEFNGGPVKKTKWYQRIQIQGAGGAAPVAPSDSNANPRGSYVDLYFDKYVPELSGPELKQLLRPVFDFDSKSGVEAYLETVPPKVKEAIKNHQVLVGMNRDMVMYSKGRPPKKIRERDGETEYEEWIYGAPPQDVDFVRFVGDDVVRVEVMSVDGHKVVRTEREVDIPQVAAAGEKPAERPVNAPTLRRPGEDMPDARPAGGIDQTPPARPSPDPGGTTPN